MRARDLEIVIGDHRTGASNTITDVAGVRVGHSTLIGGHGPLEPGSGPVRTGVTVVVPHDSIWDEPVFAGAHRLNGCGEMTGLEWVRESGVLTSPVALTNTHSVGVVRDALVCAQVRERGAGLYWSLPVVGETYDGLLNDINGHHVRAKHLDEALQAANRGPVAEGNVGGGTGMVCHEFKGGIGTSSRVAESGSREYTVGVLVQANHGRRSRLRINGVPVGQQIGPEAVPLPATPSAYEPGSGSIIIVLATNAPMLPHQCTRMAQRAALAVGRTGGVGEQYSGDIVLAFSTGNRGLPSHTADAYVDAGPPELPVSMTAPQVQTLLFDLTVEATEEAIANALIAAQTMSGRDGVTAHAIDHGMLRQAMGLS